MTTSKTAGKTGTKTGTKPDSKTTAEVSASGFKPTGVVGEDLVEVTGATGVYRGHDGKFYPDAEGRMPKYMADALLLSDADEKPAATPEPGSTPPAE